MELLLIFASIGVLLLLLGLVHRRRKGGLPWNDDAERREFRNRTPKGTEQTLPPGSSDFGGGI
ncbi:MAG: hypothetical protein ACRDP8_07780 [Actinopolymorphaceae bacterium]